MGGVSVGAWSKAGPGLRSLTTQLQERPSLWICPPAHPSSSSSSQSPHLPYATPFRVPR